MSPVFDCTTEHGRADAIPKAAAGVRDGRLVVLPTDTLYGIGADAFSPEAVRALLAAKGFAGPVDYARALFPRVPKAMAQVGDLVAVETDEGPALGVVQGAHVYLVGRTGLMTTDLLDRRVRLAFRV